MAAAVMWIGLLQMTWARQNRVRPDFDMQQLCPGLGSSNGAVLTMVLVHGSTLLQHANLRECALDVQ